MTISVAIKRNEAEFQKSWPDRPDHYKRANYLHLKFHASRADGLGFKDLSQWIDTMRIDTEENPDKILEYLKK